MISSACFLSVWRKRSRLLKSLIGFVALARLASTY
jgi:hypothetical protein